MNQDELDERQEEIRQAVSNSFALTIDDAIEIAIRDTELTEDEQEWALDNLDWRIVIVE